MLPNTAKRTIDSLFKETLDEKRRRLYFDRYLSGKSLGEVSLVDELEGEINESSIQKGEVNIPGAELVYIDEEPVLFYSEKENTWIVICSSRLDDIIRRKLRSLSKVKGWLIPAWIPGNTVDEIYDEYSPQGENISLKRSWDPYYLYKRDSKVPKEYRQYFSEHPREFSQQNVQVEIKTPKWRLEETIDNAMTDFLEQKSETEHSEFTMETPPEVGISTDGGAVSAVSSSVKVKESGKITHQSGNIGATLKLVDETATRSEWVYDLFEDVASSYEYEEHEDGSLSLSRYQKAQPLLFHVPEEFTKEISIKMSNFLTVGQNDVDLYGIVTDRNEKRFSAETQIPFNSDRYSVYVEEGQKPETTALYVRPSEGSKIGLVYLYHKLQQKFDPNVKVEKIDRFPSPGVVE